MKFWIIKIKYNQKLEFKITNKVKLKTITININENMTGWKENETSLSPNWYISCPLYGAKRFRSQSKISSRQIRFRSSNLLLSVGKGQIQVPMKKKLGEKGLCTEKLRVKHQKYVKSWKSPCSVEISIVGHLN